MCSGTFFNYPKNFVLALFGILEDSVLNGYWVSWNHSIYAFNAASSTALCLTQKSSDEPDAQTRTGLDHEQTGDVHVAGPTPSGSTRSAGII